MAKLFKVRASARWVNLFLTCYYTFQEKELATDYTEVSEIKRTPGVTVFSLLRGALWG